MLKYTEAVVGFREVPEEIALCINISNCPIHCKGCHSPHLWEDVGNILDIYSLSQLINENEGITCVAFMGGDNDPMTIYALALWTRTATGLKTCWYSGNTKLPEHVPYIDSVLDYIKLGPYDEKRGGLDFDTTNQQFFKITKHSDKHYAFEDITFKFKHNETDNKN